MYFVIEAGSISWDLIWGFIKVTGFALGIVVIALIVICLILFGKLLTADDGKENNFFSGTPQSFYKYPFYRL